MKPYLLITGATAGIGEAVARHFAAHGWRLLLTGRRLERLNALSAELRQQHNTEVHTLCFDIRDAQATAQHLNNLPEEWQTPDVLLNNAGLAAGRAPIHQGDLEDWEQMIDTNLKGLLYVTRILSARMVKAGKGHIINLGSVAGKETYPDGNVYCATKFAVDALSKAMRTDLLPYGIKVTQVCPGMVETEFSLVRFRGDERKAKAVYQGITPLTPQDIADIIWYAANTPPHVCLNDIVVTCTAQANATSFHRKPTV